MPQWPASRITQVLGTGVKHVVTLPLSFAMTCGRRTRQTPTPRRRQRKKRRFLINGAAETHANEQGPGGMQGHLHAIMQALYPSSTVDEDHTLAHLFLAPSRVGTMPCS